MAFDSLASQVLDVAGAPRSALLDVEPPTQSIDAYRAYIRGIEATSRWDISGAQEEFRRAVDLDPGFALAYYQLSAVTAFFEQTSPAPTFIALADSALRFSAQRPPKERLLIQAFHAYLNSDFERAKALSRELLEQDSTVVDAWTVLASASLLDFTLRIDSAGNEYFPSSPGAAVAYFRRALALDSSDYSIYPAVSNLLLLASQEEQPGLPSFRDPPPGGRDQHHRPARRTGSVLPGALRWRFPDYGSGRLVRDPVLRRGIGFASRARPHYFTGPSAPVDQPRAGSGAAPLLPG
jgi:tetratricopeptide (TPR) repeat protein